MTAKYFILATLALAITGLSACSNTFHGAGRDVENAGDSVQRAIPPK